jgi:hypothetical protein
MSAIKSAIRAIETDLMLYEESNFNSRADAIDFIDFHIIDRMEGLTPQETVNSKKHTLKRYALRVKAGLEKIDTDLFKRLRAEIRKGTDTRSSFSKMICKYLGPDVFNNPPAGKREYDNLDVFINGLFSDQYIPQATIVRKPGMVFYQKTPAGIIFEMVALAELKQDDVFFDLGSGLGQAVILVHLMSGIRARGVEYEAAYCHYAEACALQLNLSGVDFINADARNGDLSQGTIFFLFTPFEGAMLQDMLDILHKESQRRTIRIFTYGPCSCHVARQDWLICRNGNVDDPWRLHEFKSQAQKQQCP